MRITDVLVLVLVLALCLLAVFAAFYVGHSVGARERELSSQLRQAREEAAAVRRENSYLAAELDAANARLGESAFGRAPDGWPDHAGE